MKILVALDDSKFSKAAANAVITRMKPDGSQVKLLHVLAPFPVALAQRMGGREFPDFAAARASLRERAQGFLAATAEKFRSAGFEISYALEEGDPRDVILDNAERWPADLIVLGSHGRGGKSRFLMGSVSEAVARHARCSVEIVRMSPEHGARKTRT
jgi:nucleotide-binding universal stress UspA family protein